MSDASTIRSSVTISLVPEVRGGPFVFWDGLADGCQRAAELGFDAVEVFPPGPSGVDRQQLRGLLDEHNLACAAIGTGAGMVLGGLSLCSPDTSNREKARKFVADTIELAAEFSAPAIIGSMQGRSSPDADRDTSLGYLGESLEQLGEVASRCGFPLLMEPLNRYETDLCNTLASTGRFLESLATDSVRILADLFHMNIEEIDIADALRGAASLVGHVHFVDSNRQAAGRGHLDYQPIAAALTDIGYTGFASAEALAIPDSQTAAQQTIQSFRRWFR